MAEAEEHLGGIVRGLGVIEAHLDENLRVPLEPIETIYRQFHSLKGASQAVGFDQAGILCQQSESLLAAWKKDPSQADLATVERLREMAGKVAAELGMTLPAAAPLPLAAPAPADSEERPGPRPALEMPGAGETVRIGSRKLDSLLRRGEQLVMARLSSQQRLAEARQLMGLLESWRTAWVELEQVLSSLPDPPLVLADMVAGQREAYRMVLSSMQRHILNLATDYHELEVQLGEMLNEVKSARLAPVQPLLEELEHDARRIARQLRKKVRVTTRGGEVEVDRNILETLKDPLMHLVRNALDHGIESVEERRYVAKSDEGRLELEVVARGTGLMDIRISDDGRGIQTADLLDAARRQGLIAEGTEVDTLDLIFTSGLSTRSEVSDLSGRGLGMAIVRERVEALKGTVRVQTQVGEGTTFILSVPTSLATFDGLVVVERGRWLVFPLSGVEAVTRVRLEDIGWVEGSTVLRFRGLVLPLARLGDVLSLPPGSSPSSGGPLTVVVLTAGGRKGAFLVDQVAGVQEVLARDLGPQLRRVRYVSSACMLTGQEAAPVLNVADLLTSMRGGLRALRTEDAARAPQILAVDDSPTTRQLLRSTLEAAGYRVRTAANGMEAWHLVCSEPFALVVSDVSMPGLTGLELLGRIRSHARLSSLPVVLVTGQENEEDRKLGLEMGANAYVLKSQFEEGSLLELIGQLAPAHGAVRAG